MAPLCNRSLMAVTAASSFITAGAVMATVSPLEAYDGGYELDVTDVEYDSGCDGGHGFIHACFDECVDGEWADDSCLASAIAHGCGGGGEVSDVHGWGICEPLENSCGGDADDNDEQFECTWNYQVVQ
jgi:hypothetical protein